MNLQTKHLTKTMQEEKKIHPNTYQVQSVKLAHLFMRLYETEPPKCHETFVFKCPPLEGNKVKLYLDIDP